MIHGCVSTCDCVVHVKGLPPDIGRHQRKIFCTRVCVSTLNRGIEQKVINVHQTPLAFMHTSRNMNDALHHYRQITLETIVGIPSNICQFCNHPSQKFKPLEFSKQCCKCFKIYMILISGNVEKGKKYNNNHKKKTFFVLLMICVQCSYFNEKPQAKKYICKKI